MGPAIASTFSLRASAASSDASPPIASPRDAQAPPPNGVTALSPAITSISSMPTPSWSATIWAIAVSVPCPWSLTLVMQRILPDGSSLTVVPSWVETGASEGP